MPTKRSGRQNGQSLCSRQPAKWMRVDWTGQGVDSKHWRHVSREIIEGKSLGQAWRANAQSVKRYCVYGVRETRRRLPADEWTRRARRKPSRDAATCACLSDPSSGPTAVNTGQADKLSGIMSGIMHTVQQQICRSARQRQIPRRHMSLVVTVSSGRPPEEKNKRRARRALVIIKPASQQCFCAAAVVFVERHGRWGPTLQHAVDACRPRFSASRCGTPHAPVDWTRLRRARLADPGTEQHLVESWVSKLLTA